MHGFQSPGVLGWSTLGCLACAHWTPAQVTLDPTWPENPRTFGGPYEDVALCVRETWDGGYIVAGTTGTFDSPKEDDIYLIKADSRGRLDPTWVPNPKRFGVEGWQEASSVEQTADGGYIVAGATGSSGAGLSDVYLIKLDTRGNLDPAWDVNPKTFGGEGHDFACSVLQTHDGGYLVVGTTTSFGPGDEDVYLIKLDGQGNLDAAWDENPRTVGGSGSDRATSCQQTKDRGYIVVGYTMSFPAGGFDVYLIKLDVRGSLDSSWVPNPKTFLTEDKREFAYSVQETKDGGYVVAGSAVLFGPRGRDAFVMRLDSRGRLDPAWDPNPRTFDGPGNEGACCIQETTDSGFIVAGSRGSFGVPGDIYLMKLDSHGTLDPRWQPNPRVFGGDASEGVRSLVPTQDGGYVLAGLTYSYGAGGCDVLLLKASASSDFLRGDCNGDGRAEGIPDALSILSYNFYGGADPLCIAACDANGDGEVAGTTDAVHILRYFYMGSQESPVPPFPECGPGQLWTDGPLTCETEPPCP